MRRRRHRGRCGGQQVSPPWTSSPPALSPEAGGQPRQTGFPCATNVWPAAVGDDGKVWATGYTDCVDSFAFVDAYGRTFGGVFDVFVPALAADGASRVWGTCIGSTSDEAVRTMLCDAHGPMILGLSARSTDDPVTAGVARKRRLSLPPRARPRRALGTSDGIDTITHTCYYVVVIIS